GDVVAVLEQLRDDGASRLPARAGDDDLHDDRAAEYSSSVTCSRHDATFPSSSTCWSARCVINRVAVAPCQCSSPGSKNTLSPGRMTAPGPPRRWHRPAPSTTQIVCPFGCVCQAVRAPGMK